MKVNKEFAILITVILVLAGYLAFRHTDRLHYRLPVIAKIHADAITRIDIARSGGTITLTGKDGSWTIGPQGWQADPDKVKAMLGTLEGLRITDLVSESGSYERYELDNAKKIRIRAFAGSRPELDLSVGKTASTGRHTYVTVPGDRKVYLAEGNLNSTFGVPASDLRNTLVLAFDPSRITSIQVEHEGTGISLTRQDTGKASGSAWKNAQGEPVDKVRADTLLAVLSKVYCEGFLDDSLKGSLKDPRYVCRLKGGREYTLSVYEETGNKVPAVSSENPSPFVLPDYKLDGLKKAVQDLSGTKEQQ